MKKRPAGSGLLYGVNPLLESLRAGDRAPHEILVAESARDERLRELIELARARNVSVKRVPRAVLDRAVGNTHHQGVMARVAAARYVDAEELLSSIASHVGREAEPLLLVLDGIEDPRNLGASMPTAESWGVVGLFTTGRSGSGLRE